MTEHHKTKTQRREEAKVRQAKRDGRSDAEQLRILYQNTSEKGQSIKEITRLEKRVHERFDMERYKL